MQDPGREQQPTTPAPPSAPTRNTATIVKVIIDGGSYVPAFAGSLAVTLVAFVTLLRVSEPAAA